MKWFWKKDHPPNSLDDELAEAKRERAEAERRLRESRVAARQVRLAAIEAVKIRTDNQFSARLDQAFGSRRNG